MQLILAGSHPNLERPWINYFWWITWNPPHIASSLAVEIPWWLARASQTSMAQQWSLGMNKQFNPTLYNGCNYLYMMGINSNYIDKMGPITLQWCHNERDGVSNQRRLDGLLNRLFRRKSKKTSKLRVTDLCEGNDRWIPLTKGQWREKCFHLMTSSRQLQA